MVKRLLTWLSQYVETWLAALAEPVYTLGIEFVTGSFTNVTSRCLQGQVTRQLATLFEAPREGHAMFTLINEDGRFSPQNSASPYYPNLLPGKQVQLTASQQQRYLSLPEAAIGGNYASTPDSPVANITGDIEFIVYAAAVDWTPPSDVRDFISKLGSNIASYSFTLDPSGALVLRYTINGTDVISISSTVSLTVVDGSGVWLRATMDVDDGVGNHVVNFYTSTNLVSVKPTLVSWTQLGATVTTAGTVSIHSSTGVDIEVGTSVEGSGVPMFHGKIYRAQIYNGISGVLTVDFNPEDASVGGTLFVSRNTGEIWTINQNGSPFAEIAVEAYTDYPLFKGRAINYQLAPAFGERTVLLEAADSINRLVNTFVTTSLYTNTNAQSLFTSLMSAAQVNSFAVDGTLRDTILYAWYQDEQVVTAMQQLTEFGSYRLYEDGAGTIRLKDRTWNQGASSVATYAAAGDGLHNLDLSFSQDSVLNRVKIDGQPRRASASVNTVAWLQEIFTIAASSSVGFWLAYVDPNEPTVFAPATGLITPVSSSDWKLGTTSGGLVANATATGSLQITMFGAAAVCSLYNGSGNTVYINQFQIRGNSVQQVPQVAAETISSSSQAVYGKREYSLSNDLFNNQAFIQDYATFIVFTRAEPFPTVKFGLKNVFPDVLAREVGDIVSLVESVSAINSQWQITGVTHDIALGSGLEHTTTYDVTQSPDFGWLVLDHASRGKLDNGKLGL